MVEVKRRVGVFGHLPTAEKSRGLSGTEEFA
jgi:hypothetical protein